MSLLVHANLSNTSSEYKLKDDQEPGNEGKHVFRRNDPAHVESTVGERDSRRDQRPELKKQDTADRVKFLIVEAETTDDEEQEHEKHADIGYQECDVLFGDDQGYKGQEEAVDSEAGVGLIGGNHYIGCVGVEFDIAEDYYHNTQSVKPKYTFSNVLSSVVPSSLTIPLVTLND
ncbi:MAG: hypothetical protein BYD32DRAFT_458665 [Podila humilis]|nr:MAG: hypothetical protein BYD32DRAFT_458665 [Podila humilis]